MPSKTEQPERVLHKYLKKLDDELHPIPASQRAEIVDEVREHIDEATRLRVEDGGGTTADSARDILRTIGDPTQIAAAARERFGVPEPKSGATDVITVVLAGVGNLVIPVISTLIAAILIARSSAWTHTTKKRAILQLIASPISATLGAVMLVSDRSPNGRGPFAAVLAAIGLGLGLLGFLGLPLLVAINLARRMSPRPRGRKLALSIAAVVLLGLPTASVYGASVSTYSESTGIVSGDPTQPNSPLCQQTTWDRSIAFASVHLSVKYCASSATASKVSSFTQPICTTGNSVIARVRSTLCIAYPNAAGSFTVRAEYAVAPWPLPIDRTVVQQLVISPGSISSS